MPRGIPHNKNGRYNSFDTLNRKTKKLIEALKKYQDNCNSNSLFSRHIDHPSIYDLTNHLLDVVNLKLTYDNH